MHFSRPVIKKAGRAAVSFLASLAIALAAPAAVTAAGMGGDAGDAATGHVYIRAAVEEGYEADITMTLVPTSGGGTVYEYRLNSQNRFGISDDIAEGTYTCVPFITDPGQDGAVYVEYGGGEKDVTRGGETCFLAVAGSAGFVRDYAWISDFRDEEGEYLKGVVSRQAAEEAFLKTVAVQQEQMPEPENAAGFGAAGDEDTGKERQQQAPVPENGKEAGAVQGKRRDMPHSLAAAACLAGCAAAVYYIRKKR